MKSLKSVLTILLFFVIASFKAQTVYVTDNGKKYHAKNCDVAKTGKKEIELSEAKKQGYEACKVCKVNHETKEADKAKDKKTSDKPKK